MDQYSRIKILGDGNCMFRAVSVALNNSLIECMRNRFGKPTNSKLSCKENSLHRALRFFTVSYIEQYKYRYISPHDYDDNSYDSVEDHIEQMYNDGEYGTQIELDIISKMMNIKINIYVPVIEGFSGQFEEIDLLSMENNISSQSNIQPKLNLISTKGKDKYKKTINLVLEESHYEVIIFDEEPKNTNIIKEQPLNIYSQSETFTPITKNIKFERHMITKTITHTGILLNNFNPKHQMFLEELSEIKGEKCGYKINDKCWFFDNNYNKLEEYAIKNDIEWLV